MVNCGFRYGGGIVLLYILNFKKLKLSSFYFTKIKIPLANTRRIDNNAQHKYVAA
jgi:hypothetical protein